MTGLEIFAVGAISGVASKWGFDRYISKKVRWPSWRGQDSSSGTIVLEDLKKITGIGPAYAGQLNKAGILNYTDLIEQTPERIQEIVGSVGLDEISNWIEQATLLVKGADSNDTQISSDAEMAKASVAV